MKKYFQGTPHSILYTVNQLWKKTHFYDQAQKNKDCAILNVFFVPVAFLEVISLTF